MGFGFPTGNESPATVGLTLGFFGSTALLITTILTSSGSAIYISYAALITVTLAALRTLNWASFSRRFFASFLTFTAATIILYLYIAIISAGSFLDISVWGHAWRLGFMAAIGGILSLAVAYLADIGRADKKPFLAALALGTLGGGALFVSTKLMVYPPLPVFISYAVFIMAIFTMLRVTGWPAFHQWFAASFLAFMVATVMMFLFAITAIAYINAGASLLWTFGLITAVGVILSLAAAYLFDFGPEPGKRLTK